MNESQDLVTKKYLQESFKDFGETLMKIFVTKEEFRIELSKLATKQELDTRIDKLEDKIFKSNEKLLKSNDKIVKLLIEARDEQASATHRMDRIETEHGARITTLEQKVFEN